MAHCWKDYRTHLEKTGKIYSDEWVATYLQGNATCMREHGHKGDHDFVDDNSIVVKSKDDATPTTGMSAEV